MKLKNLKLIHTFFLQLTGEETHYFPILVLMHGMSSYMQKFGIFFIFLVALLVSVFWGLLGFFFFKVGFFIIIILQRYIKDEPTNISKVL